MNVGQVIAEVMKREGVNVLLTYPLKPLTEFAAAADIRPIVVRQERIGVHMADAIGRLSSAERVGVFCCQAGPGIENAFDDRQSVVIDGNRLVQRAVHEEVVDTHRLAALEWIVRRRNGEILLEPEKIICQRADRLTGHRVLDDRVAIALDARRVCVDFLRG